jgi:DNA-binding response OmpR family regulator
MEHYMLKPVKILLVEDDEIASEIIYEFLQDCSFDVTPVFTATDSVSYLRTQNFDLVLLDINLPDFDGYEVLKSIKYHVSLPIIITSAYNDTKSKLLAFKYGASDYMVKPLDLEELEARIWVQLGKHGSIEMQEEKGIFELKNSAIFFKNSRLDLTTTEFEILSLLMKHKNQVVSRDELVSALSSISSKRSLDNHIKNIRKKIGDNGNKATILKTEYGVGYALYT